MLRYALRMKHIVLASMLLVVAVASPVCAATQINVQRQTQYARVRDAAPQSRFAPSIEDLPLMPGLEIEGDDVLFVFGSDRIAQTTAKGKVDVDEVYYFYQATLPQLGWTEVNARLYERAGEKLSINASSASSDGFATVKFEVTPQ